MERVFVLGLLVIALGAHNSSAQLISHFGVKAAITSSIQEFDYSQSSIAPEIKRRVGFNAGVYAEWLNMPYFSIVTQVEYAQRGMGMDFVVTGPSGPQPLETKTVYSRVDYLSVPALMKVRFQFSMITPYVLAGPRLDILLGYQSDEGVFNALYDQFTTLALGGSVAVGVQIESLLPVPLLIEARYNVDFTNSYETNLLIVRNRAFDFWLGVAL
jgi:hypothetical protein